jgi:HEAT repeat protein
VALTSLLALCRGGDQASCDEIRRLASEGDENFRRAAEWALSQLRKAAPVEPEAK